MAIAWLRDLEEKVQEATARLAELREENRRLTERVSELEGQLAEAAESDDGAAWAEERGEIQQRVEALVEQLDSLLQEE